MHCYKVLLSGNILVKPNTVKMSEMKPFATTIPSVHRTMLILVHLHVSSKNHMNHHIYLIGIEEFPQPQS